MTTVSAAETQNFLVPNATIIVEFLIFIVILIVFWRFVVPPLTKAMQERQEMVKKQAEDRQAAARRLDEARERYESSLAEARAEAAGIRDEARAEAQKIRDGMRADTDREVERIRARGEEQLAAHRAEAVEQLRGEIGGLSTQLASRILGTPVGTDGPQRSTVDRFLTEIDGKRNTARSSGGTPVEAGGPT